MEPGLMAGSDASSRSSQCLDRSSRGNLKKNCKNLVLSRQAERAGPANDIPLPPNVNPKFLGRTVALPVEAG
jgi:hypothetical protein